MLPKIHGNMVCTKCGKDWWVNEVYETEYAHTCDCGCKTFSYKPRRVKSSDHLVPHTTNMCIESMARHEATEAIKPLVEQLAELREELAEIRRIAQEKNIAIVTAEQDVRERTAIRELVRQQNIMSMLSIIAPAGPNDP